MIYFDSWCRRIWASALVSGCLLSSATALELGPVTIQSALGEPLRAEIEIISISPEESASLKANVAAPDRFKARRLDYNPALDSVQVTIQRPHEGRVVSCSARSCRTIMTGAKNHALRLTSSQPITAPFIDLVLEVNSSSGQRLRDFALAFHASSVSVAAAKPLPAATAAAPAVSVTPGTAAPAPTPVVTAPQAAADTDPFQPRIVSGPPPAQAEPAPAPLAQTPEPATAPGFELGLLTVQSAPGEPLQAEIEIKGIAADEASSLKARVAPLSEFKAKGLNYNPILTDTQIIVQRPSGPTMSCSAHICRTVLASDKYTLRLTSPQPYTQTTLDVVLELTSASGHQILALPQSRAPANVTAVTTKPEVVAPPLPPVVATSPVPAAPGAAEMLPASRIVSTPATPSPVTAPAHAAHQAQNLEPLTPPMPQTPAPRMQQAASTPPTPAEPSKKALPASAIPSSQAPVLLSTTQQVVVKPGYVARKIAATHKPAGVSLDQMLFALLKANPDAFIGGNVNRLKIGAVLDIPSSAAVSAIHPELATCNVTLQAKLFNEFRRESPLYVCVAAPPKKSKP